MMPRALSWSSPDANRMRSRSVISVSCASMPAVCILATSRSRSVSSMTAPRAADTCTAGSSPNRLGSANTTPTRSAAAMSAYFHAGYWLIMRG